MAKFEWIDKLNKYLINILDEEKSIEYQRQRLGRIPEFEPFAAFQRFDRDNKKFIDTEDIKIFLKENNTRYSDTFLREFIKHYDKDNNGVLNFEEFLPIVLTKSDEDLRAVVTQRQNYTVSPIDYLMPDIEECLTIVLKMEMKFSEIIIAKSETVRNLYGYNNRDAFKQIDFLNYGFITNEELIMYMKRNGFYLANYEISQLFNRLDRDGDGKISFKDFQGLFYPEKKNMLVKSNNNEQKNMNKNNTFNRIRSSQLDKSTTMSSFMPSKTRTSNFSPMRQTLDLRASLNSYTSPMRGQKSTNYMNHSRTFNEDRRITSPNRSSELNLIRNTSPVRNNIFINDEQNSIGEIEKNNDKDNMKISVEYSSKNKNGLIDYDIILANFFKKLISFSINSETAKEKFALKCDTNLSTLFSIFDPFKYNSINIFDFKDGLNELGIFTSMDEMRLIFKRYDLDRDDKLSFGEFSSMICSIKSDYSKLITDKRVYNNNLTTTKDTSSSLSSSLSSIISEETKTSLAELFRALINTEIQVESLRKISTDKPTFIISSAFNQIKDHAHSMSTAKNFLNRNDVSYYLYHKLVRRLFKKTRNFHIFI